MNDSSVQVELAELCAHPSSTRVNGQSCCNECGETILSFCREENNYFEDPSNSIGIDARLPKSIKKEIDMLSLSSDIKERADKIYADTVGNNTYRANVRQEIKFSCIYKAYKEAGAYKDPCEIANMLGIKRKGMSRGIYRCSFLCTGKVTENNAITAIHLIPHMLERNGVQYSDCHIEDITRIYDYAKVRSELLNRSKPQSCAAGLVYFYLSKMEANCKLNKIDIAKNCKVSVMTLSKIDAELEVIVGAMLAV